MLHDHGSMRICVYRVHIGRLVSVSSLATIGGLQTLIKKHKEVSLLYGTADFVG